MEVMIFIVFAFLVLVHVYSFIKIRRKRKEKNKSNVSEFHKTYHRNTAIRRSPQTDNNYNKYVTKYNSSVDYISKDEFM